MIAAIDHVVLTTRDGARCLAFYAGVLGMALERYAEGRTALRFGQQKINVHQPGVMATLKAHMPTPGSPDRFFLCRRNEPAGFTDPAESSRASRLRRAEGVCEQLNCRCFARLLRVCANAAFG